MMPIGQQRERDGGRVERAAGASPSASAWAMSSPGSLPVQRQAEQILSWLAKMMTAMPAVKPTVTG